MVYFDFPRYLSDNDYLCDHRTLLGRNFRTFPVRDPANTLISLEQNIEPHDVIITDNGRTAFVSLPVRLGPQRGFLPLRTLIQNFL